MKMMNRMPIAEEPARRGSIRGKTGAGTGVAVRRLGSHRMTAGVLHRDLLRWGRQTMTATSPTMMIETVATQMNEADSRTSQTEGPLAGGPAPTWRRKLFASIRSRLLASFVAVLALAAIGSVIVVRGILLQRLDERINRELVQEAKELRRLANGNDPDTGEPFGGRVKRIFDVFLERNIPSRNEALLTFVDGSLYARSRQVVPYQLDQDPIAARWANLKKSDRGRVDTPEGAVEYIAVPLRRDGTSRGVFVAAIFRDLERAETDPAIVGAAVVGAVTLVIGSLLAWRMATKVLTPVKKVRDTALSISETDLRGRIDVEGEDEIAQLAATFNEMLDRLEDAFAAQRRFIDDAGHELRTPITIVRGQLEVMGDDPEDRRRTLHVVMDELDRMSRFVTDLLLLARAERPDFLNLETVDVSTLTEELRNKAHGLATRRWEVDQVGVGRIVADRQRLTQAIMQLAENATQFTEDGDSITLGSQVSNGEARFWVTDSGPGLSPEDQEYIFDRFRRGRGARRTEGAGLGLSIVKAIASAHHGRVELRSRPGEGATFTVVIPVDQPPPQDVRIET
jgi:signal transduction histidine kinase